MARLRKKIQSLNLYKYDVLIEDTGARSDYFKVTQFDGYFYGGRNAFLVAGATTLKPNSKILVEILNVNGDTVFSAPVANFIEGNSRLVQVEVYEDTPPGPGKLVILGSTETYIDGTPIPPVWRDKYNIRWIVDVIISPKINNKTPIRFVNHPAVTVSEKFYSAPGTSSLLQTSSVPANFELKPINYNIFQNGYLISLINPDGTNKFTSDYIGGTLDTTIAFPDTSEFISASIPITKILNSTIAESRGTIITSSVGTAITTAVLSSSGDYYTTRIEPYGIKLVTSSQSLIKYNRVIESVNTSSISSFARMVVSNLNTISGEVNKLRISYKPTTEPGEYIILGDVRTNVQELLAVDGIKNIIEFGKFKDVSVGDYWYAATMSASPDDKTSTLPAYYLSSSLYTNLTPIKSSEILLDSISVTPDIAGNAFRDTKSYFIGTNNDSNIQLFPNSEYTFKLTAIAAINSASIALQQSNYLAEVYLVSSEQTTNTTLLNQTNKGQLIAVLQLNKESQKQLFENVEFNFTPKITQPGTFGLRIVVYGGFWNFSNISLKPAEEKFFNPDEISLLIPNVNFSRKLLTFKTDFLDINNNSIGISAFSTPVFFIGTSTFTSTGASVSIGTFPPVGAAPGDLWWNSEEGQLKIYYFDGDSFQWVDASGETIETVGGPGSITNISSSYAVTASYALNGGGGGNSLFAISGSTIYSTETPKANFSPFSSLLIGEEAGVESTDSYNSIFIGPSAGTSASNSDQSVFIGSEAGRVSTNSRYAVIIGAEAGESAEDIGYSVAIGRSAGRFVSMSSGNVLIGDQAGAYTTQVYNTNAIGFQAGSGITNSVGVNSIGDYSGIDSSAWQTTFVGFQAGGHSTVSHSLFIGENAGYYNSSSYSTFIGYYAGASDSFKPKLGNNNIIIGTNITLPENRNDSINIGGILFGTGSHANILLTDPYSGSVGNGRIGINVVNPQYALHVSGTIFATNGITGSLFGTSSQAITASYYNVPTNLRTSTIGVIIDGGGSAISVGEKAEMLIPFNCTIQSWALLADQSGSTTVEIWKSTYGTYPPTSASSIVGSAKPSITANVKNTSSTLTGWTTTINKNDTLKFYVSSSGTIQRVNLTLEVLRP